jgi:hypothetical protein
MPLQKLNVVYDPAADAMAYPDPSCAYGKVNAILGQCYAILWRGQPQEHGAYSMINI